MNIKKHNGILYCLLVLVLMSLSCHISNFLFPKGCCKNINHQKKSNKIINNMMEKFNSPRYNDNDMKRFNKINYLDLDECTGLPCSRIREENHPDVPCNIYKQCYQTVEADTPFKLSDEDKMALTLLIYGEAGLEAMGRNKRN